MSLSGPVRARIVVNLQIIGVLIFRGSSGLCFCFCFVLFFFFFFGRKIIGDYSTG